MTLKSTVKISPILHRAAFAELEGSYASKLLCMSVLPRLAVAGEVAENPLRSALIFVLGARCFC